MLYTVRHRWNVLAAARVSGGGNPENDPCGTELRSLPSRAPSLAQDAIRQSQAAGQRRTDWIVMTTVTHPPR